MFLVILIISVVCLFFAFKKRRPLLLVIPFATIFGYFIVQAVMVPAPFFETVKFIFSLGS